MNEPSWTTADLCDQFEQEIGDGVAVLAPIFRSFGARPSAFGRVVTLHLFEDNSLVRSTLAENGHGKLLVVDGGGSMRRALLGDQLAQMAVDNRWQGIVINGCVRDTSVLAQLPIAIYALAAHPQKTQKRGWGDRDVPVTIAGVTIKPGHWLYADSDGLIRSEKPLHPSE